MLGIVWTILKYIGLLVLLKEAYSLVVLLFYYAQLSTNKNIKKGSVIVTFEPSFVKFAKLGYSKLVKNDILYKYKRDHNTPKHRKADILVTNDLLKNHKAVVWPLSAKSMDEFFAKESKNCIKTCPINYDVMGFFFINGHEGMKQRKSFQEIFKFDNIVKMVPHFKKIIRKHVKKVE